ncbi:hypothetical protein Tdes44962_MAKER02429 [Teratosphaeria destructans]|uniref:Myb-like domain-containing protein n=1 Tax=Teratosphaeria destructans TaxID=418781 RepID=A0A9W7W3B3_9PEZI|nr:hypothetical protein Tdes44962_MAKER02429 [Teratosphaeria destructans]
MASSSHPAGFMSATAGPQKVREQKMKWTAERDRELLLWAHGRVVGGRDFEVVAKSFAEKPSTKSVQVRMAKLKHEQMALLRDSGILGGSGDEGEAESGEQMSALVRKRAVGVSPLSPASKRRKTSSVAPSGARFAAIMEALEGLGVPGHVLREAHEEALSGRTEDEEMVAAAGSA